MKLSVFTAVALAAIATPVFAIDGSSAEGERTLTATLSGAAEVPGPGDSDGRGKAELRVNPALGSVCYTVTFSEIDAPTMAHIHTGAAGTAGGVLVPLKLAADGSYDGCTGIAREQALALIASPEGFYANIHNAAFPAGAIRGQLSK